VRVGLLSTAVVLGYLVFGAVVLAGLIGFTLAAFRMGRRRHWRLLLLLPFTVASSLVALMGGWVVFALTWPFVYLKRTRDPADDRRGWTWTAPPNWPAPPTGFVPPPGWTADPGWPPAPRGHVFWHRTRRGQWQRRLVYGAAALSLLVPSGFIAGSVVVGPCFFDPPPGDQTSLQVANDSGTDVAVVDCLDDRCRTAQSRTSIPMGAQAAMPLESCAGGTMGVLEPRSDQLLNCISEPTEEGDGGLRGVVISEGRPCSSPRKRRAG